MAETKRATEKGMLLTESKNLVTFNKELGVQSEFTGLVAI